MRVRVGRDEGKLSQVGKEAIAAGDRNGVDGGAASIRTNTSNGTGASPTNIADPPDDAAEVAAIKHSHRVAYPSVVRGPHRHLTAFQCRCGVCNSWRLLLLLTVGRIRRRWRVEALLPRGRRPMCGCNRSRTAVRCGAICCYA